MDKFKELADAIRAGCKGTTQGFGRICAGDNEVCAIGAAAVGVGIDTSQQVRLVWDETRARFPVLDARANNEALFTQIVIRNDYLEHTREAIADWVENEAPKEFTLEQV